MEEQNLINIPKLSLYMYWKLLFFPIKSLHMLIVHKKIENIKGKKIKNQIENTSYSIIKGNIETLWKLNKRVIEKFQNIHT